MADLPGTWIEGLRLRSAGFDLADPDLCFRPLHGEGKNLRCDRFGPVCWFYRYASGEPSDSEVAQFSAFSQAAGARHWHSHGMNNRGSDPHTRRHITSQGAPDTWRARENGLHFELRAGSGQSPGLFLDQRDNRAWVRRHAQGARILNLFAYTGGFGIAALAGGASQVLQVDVSRPYLDWARTNAALNRIDDDSVEYSAVDARLLVDGCHRRGRHFDGIICDPPSFGRGRGHSSRLFRIERDLGDLLSSCLRLVDPGGWVLVSSNYEGWNQAHFEGTIRRLGADIETAPGAGDDFRVVGPSPMLKSCILRL